MTVGGSSSIFEIPFVSRVANIRGYFLVAVEAGNGKKRFKYIRAFVLRE
jgi:hypothetical protein